jgi:uncharacterized LabA/DUF88 family protein
LAVVRITRPILDIAFAQEQATDMPMTRVTRVYAYIDGWNFYCAINEPRRLRYGWCNFVKLADALALRLFAEKTRLVKYFNTPVEQKKDQINEGELERSRMWFRALEIETGLKPIRGRFKKDETSITKRREKEADVHLAVDMLSDAPNYDAALLVSADTDFRPLIRKLAGERGKTVVVCCVEARQARPETDLLVPNWRTEPIPDSLLEECRLANQVRDPSTGETILWDHYIAMKGRNFPPSNRMG